MAVRMSKMKQSAADRGLGTVAIITLVGCGMAWFAGVFSEKPDFRVNIRRVRVSELENEIPLLVLQYADRRKISVTGLRVNNSDSCLLLNGTSLPQQVRIGRSIIGELTCEPTTVTISTDKGVVTYPVHESSG